MAATLSPPFDRPRLAAWLTQARAATRAEPRAVELLPGGAIQENWGVEAEFIGGPFAGRQRLVLRADAATGVPSSLGRVEEFAVQLAAHRAGVSVAEPLFASDDPAIIGKPF